MAGTKVGGLKAARTNLKKHGNDFYAKIGAKGGRNGHTGGFASNLALARVAGRKGGRISTRKGIKNGEGKWRQHKNTYKILKDGKVITKINVKYIPTN
jgi:general stress protein YciG